MAEYRLYHYPGCSKSRAALALLEERHIPVTVVLYQEQAPTVAELDHLCQCLGKRPLEIMRTQDKRFAELGLSPSDDRSNAQWLELIHQHPALLERPILQVGDQAVVGRPPEQVLTLLPTP
jgi:arsenate reductase